MESKTLSPAALELIEKYLHLPFKEKDVQTPYFNNRRQKVRGALRVLIGKGSVEDITEEATIFSLKEKVDLKKMESADIKKYLIDHNIGIDCSGLAYYLLDEELRAQNKKPLRTFLFFPSAKNIFRKLLVKLRPVENAGVRTFNHEKNTREISLDEALPGDMIIMMETGKDHDLNHMLVLQKIEYENKKPKVFHYTHSLAWSTDGKYGHGVRQGTLEITSPKDDLLAQNWIEQGFSSQTNEGKTQNETFYRASTARELCLKRLAF